MKRIFSKTLFFAGLLWAPLNGYAQEEDQEIIVEQSAEVFLDEYSDAFQENFFEALKQKGIENYDKAINLFLACKQIDAENKVVDHELAKVYMQDKQYVIAEEYAITALQSAPENLWYLDTAVAISQKQGASLENLQDQIPYSNTKLKENLALIYYQRANYANALKVLKEVKKTTFSEELSAKINDSIEKQKTTTQTVSFSANTNSSGSNDISQYKVRLKGLITANNIAFLLQLSEEALETYPSQPYFYYANGYALNKKAKHRDAIEVLEAALDYMIGDVSLANKIYNELADAYTALHNTVKANMYLRKVKPGF